MCMLCEADSVYYLEVLPGWHLSRARRAVDHTEIQPNSWLLTKQNTPEMVWKEIPKNLPEDYDLWFADLSEEDFDAWEDFYMNSAVGIDIGYEIYSKAVQVGFKDEPYKINAWLFKRMSDMLAEVNWQPHYERYMMEKLRQQQVDIIQKEFNLTDKDIISLNERWKDIKRSSPMTVHPDDHLLEKLGLVVIQQGQTFWVEEEKK